MNKRGTVSAFTFFLAFALGGAIPLARADPNYPLSYQLRNLRPVGLTFLSGNPSRQLLQFQNEQGAQNFLYEEGSQLPPVREIASLSPFLAGPNYLCSVDVDCRLKAVCTNNCLSYFYEISNLPTDKAKPERDNCVIRSFSCNASQAPEPQPARAAPAPRPVQVAPSGQAVQPASISPAQAIGTPPAQPQLQPAAPLTQTVIVGPSPATKAP